MSTSQPLDTALWFCGMLMLGKADWHAYDDVVRYSASQKITLEKWKREKVKKKPRS
jgi:hypothetical protein